MKLSLKILNSISEVNANDWNAICGIHYPFLRHEFLQALEESDCTIAETGWQAIHFTIYNDDNLVAIMPMFQKTHSSGEFVFDWDWADAYHRNGLDYYPKLVTAIPFSPCFGQRIASNLPLTEVIPFIQNRIIELCQTYHFSGWHGLFFPHKEINILSNNLLSNDLPNDSLFLSRQGIQYHWFNNEFETFDHYLTTFTSRKRKGIKRERRKVSEQGIDIKTVEGKHIDNQLLQDFFHCYQLTYLKRGRNGYLNIDFFQRLIDSLSEHIVIFVAKKDSKTVACAWCFKNTDPEDSVLYGRYWGALEEFDNLHFETCYYQALEYCILHKIQRFDPGAQGEHKIQRGFKPINTYSSHYIDHPQFREAIADFLNRETMAIDDHKEHLKNFLPFKKTEESQSI